MLHHVHAVYNGEPIYCGTFNTRDTAKVVTELTSRGYETVTVDHVTVNLPGFLRGKA